MATLISDLPAKATELIGNSPSGENVIVTSDLEAHDGAAAGRPIDLPVQRLGFLSHLNIKIPDSFFFDPMPEEELRLCDGYEDDEA